MAEAVILLMLVGCGEEDILCQQKRINKNILADSLESIRRDGGNAYANEAAVAAVKEIQVIDMQIYAKDVKCK